MAYADSQVFEAFGVTFLIRGKPAGVYEAICAAVLLPDWSASDLPPKHSYSVRWAEEKGLFVLQVGDNDVCHSVLLEQFGQAVRAIIHHQIAQDSDQIFLHAAALAVNGQALLLPGRTHTGKSTLTWALLQAGASYLSDEYAVLCPESLLIRPFPRPLHLRSEHGYRTPGGAARTPVPARHLLFLEYQADTKPLDLRPLTTGEATVKLIQNTVAAKRILPAGLSTLSQMVAGTQAHAGFRGEAGAAAAHIMAVLSAP